MTLALVDVYAAVGDHLDAYADRRAPRAAAHRRTSVDPRAGDRGAAPPAHLPRREVARRPPALRPRRPARGRGRQHRQLRCGDVHDAGRHRQRRRSRRRLRRGDRHRRRPPVELRPRGRRRVRRRGRRGDAPGSDDRVGRRRRPRRSPTTARGRRSRRSPSVAAEHDRLARRARSTARRGRPVRHGRPALPSAGDGRPAAEPHEVDRGAADRPRPRSSWPAATTARRCSAPSTTDATPTRSPRWRGRSPARWAAPKRSSGVARRRVRRRAGSTSSLRRRHWSTSPSTSGRATPNGAARPRRRASLRLDDDPPDVGAARGPRRPRPRRQAPRRVRRRRDRRPVGRRRGQPRAHRTAARPPNRRRRPSVPSPASCSTNSTRVPPPAALLADEPDDLDAIERAGTRRAHGTPPSDDLEDRVHGGWLGRAAGCLLGKPVEKIPREGIRAIAESTGNWPLSGYFTAVGLDPDVAAAYPWNRASRARPASPRTSPGCPRTTTSTSPCSPSASSSVTATR